LDADCPYPIEVRPQRLMARAAGQSGSLGEAEQLVEVGKE
jgi:hypothetical protein